MSLEIPSEVAIQREYYARTADKYEEMHIHSSDAHFFSLQFLVASLDFFGIKSVLDIGSGTGRAIQFIKSKRPDIKVLGVEPAAELREIGYTKGLSRDELISGDGLHLEFSDDSFDLCCEFGVLHHVRSSERVVAEMMRVGKKGIFLSDSNNFGQGSQVSRLAKQAINFLRLWKIADYIKTGGKGYTISEGDGLAYSYSVFNNYKQIAKSCQIHLLNTSDGGVNPYRTAGSVALLAIKRTHLAQPQ
jgi:ubiquinone/menaquinone biosynthesis C-methylase UbiE